MDIASFPYRVTQVFPLYEAQHSSGQVQIIVSALWLKNPSVASVAARKIVPKWLSMKETNAPAGVQTNAQADVQTTVLSVNSLVFSRRKDLPASHPMSKSVPLMLNCLLSEAFLSSLIVRFGQDLAAHRHSLRNRTSAVSSM